MQYCVAEQIWAFHGDLPVRDTAPWNRFRCNASLPPDYSFQCSYVDVLPKIEGAHYFYDPVRCREYAASREESTTLHLFVLKDVSPWGEKIHQLYEELALPHVLLFGQKLLLHASYIETEAGAILFTAPSGTGKSTQAELWKMHRNAVILNGDRAVVGLSKGVPTVYGYPMSGSSKDCENRSLPLRGLVFLRQAPENCIRRLRGKEALRVLLNGSYHDPKHPEDLSRKMDVALSLIDAPIFELSCRPDLGAVEVLEQALFMAGSDHT